MGRLPRPGTQEGDRSALRRLLGALGSHAAALVALLIALVLVAVACGSDGTEAQGSTVDDIVAGEIAVGSPVEIESVIISPIEGANSPSFSFFVRGADSRADPLLVIGVDDLDGADAGDLVRIVGTVSEAPPNTIVGDSDVVVAATTVSLLEERQLDEGDFDDKTDAPDPTDVERDDPVTEDPDGLVGPDSDIPSGGEGVPQYPAPS